MSRATSFSTVSHDLVSQYGEVGKHLVGAYRLGVQRLIKGSSARYASLLNARELPFVSDAVKASLIESQVRLADMVEDRMSAGTQRVEQAIEALAGGVQGGIARASATVQRVETAFSTDAMSTIGQLSLPAALLSLDIAQRTAASTQRLSARVAEAPTAAQTEATTAEPVRAARPARKTAARTAAKSR